MCTAITLKNGQGAVYFGRTMDFSYPLEPELYFVPKGYEWNNISKTHKIRNRYHFMGIGQDISPIVFADGVNEAGFAAAALYFPGFAAYDSEKSQSSQTITASAIEVVGFLLGQCSSVRQAASLLQSIRIVGVRDAVTGTVAPLHWIMADGSGACMTAEKTAEGMQLLDNPVGVLSNSPDFRWHLTNLRNYLNISPSQRPEADWGALKLTPFGQGAGTLGLPGDFTPPSRFVRAAYLKSHVTVPDDRAGAVNASFHVLENVSIPKGTVVTDRGTEDYTQYTAIMDLGKREYFYRTYENSGITAVKMPIGRKMGDRIVSLGKVGGKVEFGGM